jgi:transcriptional regulator with XRE-family HTH domain
MRCQSCEKDMRRIKATHHYTESGLSNVYLRDWDTYNCPDCEVNVPLLPSAKLVARLIAWAIIRAPEILSADSILFLRKAMGLTAVALAEELGVSRVEISRWENGHVQISHSSEFKLRMTAARLVVPEQLASTKLEITDLFIRRSEPERIKELEYINLRPEMASQFAYA